MTTTMVYRPRPLLEIGRRTFDTLFSLILLIAVSPILLIACAAIVMEDGGPLFFTQRRVGRYEKLFTIYKLRTFRTAHCGDAPKVRNGRDPRITSVGRFLRRTSIDELPQLFNVVRGEMSIVGPRPEMPLMTKRYEKWQHMRHLVRPGITCIWQTSSRSLISLERPEATSLDLAYIRTASFAVDGRLLARTVLAVVFPKGAF
jgi:lipopolysaccharide/colanic/teichoic acid biosynthesis glycosyltransferase